MIHKTTRSILSVLLAALLLVTSTPLTPAFADGGAVSLQSESGEGRALEPADDGTYLIYTADDLKEFADIVNGIADTPADKDANAKLMNDIDLNGSEENPWTPIGNSEENAYTGTFDGNGKTIENLYINNTTNDYYQGLFGYLSTDGDNIGTVQNLSVSGTVSGRIYVGGVVGLNLGSVEDCAFTGSVSGVSPVGGVVGWNSGSVINCYNTGEVSGSGWFVGGVVGYNIGDGSVTNSYNTGAVSGLDSGSGNSVGGVVGYNSSSGNVTNCYNTGAVNRSGNRVGGVVGWNDGSVKNCYNTGKVTGSGKQVGGVVGYNRGSSGGSGSVTDCYFLQDTAEKGIGGNDGSGDATAAKDLPELCNALASDINTWSISPFYDHPVLQANPEGGDGTAAHPYEIKTAAQLETFRDLVNGANNQTADTDAHAKLMNDINLNGNEKNQWTPIGNSFSNSYSGNFDGDGHTISGLYINSSSDNYQGLFGYLRQGGTVQNLTVSGTVSGGMHVGGIAGQNNGSVKNCYNTGAVSGSGWYVGGVVGDNRGTVENCYNTGTVTGTDDYVGGVVGYNSSIVENCYNTDTVTGNNFVGGVVGDNGGSVKNCYNTGEVNSRGNSVGGVVGNNISSVTNCYFLQTTEVNDKLQGIGGGSGDAAAKDDTAFHSGEVAWRLQNGQAEDQITPVWGQNLMIEPKDNYPQLRAFDADTPQVYKVAFMNDSEEHDAKYANSGMTVTPPEEPKKTDHLFGGWFNNGELTGDPVTGPISVTGNATYTAKWTPFSYTLSATPDTLNFGSITEGEERPAAQTVTVKNTGNQTVTLNPPAAENFEIGTLSAKELKPDESATFTIQPKENLPRGSYSEQIAISNTNGEKAAITATFTVKEPPYTGKYSYEVSTSVGDNGTVTVDRYATEGDKVTIDVTPDQAYKLDDLTVTAGGKDVELTANSDGTYSFTMPSADVKITATFAEDPDWTPDEPEEPATDVSDLFIDIAPDAWYKDAIQYAYDNGLMTGVSATEFAPEQTTTRAMIVSILARLEGVESAQAAGFADVDNEWYATAVNWAANVGVVNGYEDNTFQPNTAITREQLAAILMNYAAYKGEDVSNRADLTSYTDQPSTWAQEAMQWAVAEGLINGVTNDQLQPQGNATRAQVAAILQRFLDK